MPQRGVDPVFSTTTPIRYRDANGGGTGFFLNYNNHTFIVTNRHVVNPEEDDINPTGADVWFRNATDVGQANRNVIRFVKSGSPTWYDHPENPDDIDLAVIPINPRFSSLDDVTSEGEQIYSGNLAFTLEHIIHENVIPDKRISIIGYPGDFMDRLTRFPVRRNALISSPYEYGFKNNPYFLTDARMHPGTSGSPVIMDAASMQMTRGDVPNDRMEDIYLIGIHSATFYGEEFEEQNEQEEEECCEGDYSIQLDLNVAWYPQLLMDILDNIDMG